MNMTVMVSGAMILLRLVAIIQQVLNDFSKMIGYVVLLVSHDMALHVICYAESQSTSTISKGDQEL